MAMRPVPLMNLRQGINRLRVKGGANGQTLYDLYNAWITADGSVNPREGTTRTATLTSATKGLMAQKGGFNVFSTVQVAVPSGYTDNILVHPTDPTQTIKKIWFAKPFMGFPYVIAEFTDGVVAHYWLQSSGTWTANTVYTAGTLILPTVPTGLAYQATRVSKPNSTWQPQVSIAQGNIVEPTEANGYYFRAVAVSGSAPHTGSSEPTWPSTVGAKIQEFGDFDLNTTDSGTSGTDTGDAPLANNITDRYGNSSDVASGGSSSSISTLPSLASETVVTWTPGTLYAPGAVVKPSTSQGAFIGAIPNGDFEAGNDGSWILSSGVAYVTGAHQYQGNECLSFTASHSLETAIMNTFGVVTPGQSVTASAYFNPASTGADMAMFISLMWYDSSNTFLSRNDSAHQENGGYRLTSVTGVAPANAARCRVMLSGGNNTSSRTGYADLVTWNLETPAPASNFIYEAVQANAATSGTNEPTWPTTAGGTVIDNGVTWKAIGTSIITWEAIPIMQSGATEPVWPTTVGLAVNDASTFTDQLGNVNVTSISWVASSRQVTDPKNPNSKVAALAASHVFAGDDDIVPFSAAVNPTDWSSANDAGYLPTGLNNYGDNPVAVLTLYRSNLIAMNAGGYQMWQVDPDPANMALLDAQPVGSIYTQAAQAVANDLLFATEVGVRNLGTAGANANMQIGSLGQPVDKIVKPLLDAGTYWPLSLYYPGRGQYWLIFGPQAIVLTVNGTGLKTWSRFVFPEAITDSCLNEGKLYLRTATDKVWLFDDAALQDDVGGTPVDFLGWVQWPYLDSGTIGANKMLVGIDLIATGAVDVRVAYREDDPTTFIDSAGFNTSLNVTPSYIVNPSDIVPGTPLPFPITAPSYSLILIFQPNQVWEWQVANLYVSPISGAGATS